MYTTGPIKPFQAQLPISQELDGRVKCHKDFPKSWEVILTTERCLSHSTRTARRHAGMKCDQCCLLCEHATHKAMDSSCTKEKHQYCYFAAGLMCKMFGS